MNLVLNGVTLLLEVGFSLMWLGHLRPRDVGLRFRDLYPALLFMGYLVARGQSDIGGERSLSWGPAHIRFELEKSR
jgi:hypothetical protein